MMDVTKEGIGMNQFKQNQSSVDILIHVQEPPTKELRLLAKDFFQKSFTT